MPKHWNMRRQYDYKITVEFICFWSLRLYLKVVNISHKTTLEKTNFVIVRVSQLPSNSWLVTQDVLASSTLFWDPVWFSPGQGPLKATQSLRIYTYMYAAVWETVFLWCHLSHLVLTIFHKTPWALGGRI